MATASLKPPQLMVFLKDVFLSGNLLALPTWPAPPHLQCYTDKEREVAAPWGTP